ncbi:hypothetical protein PE067_06540 [Paracoccus sp. DMF-8]|uniref:hypothetical protein n=1 Tax=Paracoccus sp. DMF-8 TaxID=3019445 RepID=UPI0023E7A29E|nr:hypothetical protein [Paracoccus sp. DMF-8]MDF3605834.1 hypothetical protein [Paracoccus sp. DMF-8]
MKSLSAGRSGKPRPRRSWRTHERARDYLAALDLCHEGKQKAMASRLEVSEAWLSRYLWLARLPDVIVEACSRRVTELKDCARSLRPMLSDAKANVLAEAAKIAARQQAAQAGQGTLIAVPTVLARLKEAAYGPRQPRETARIDSNLTMQQRGRKIRLEFSSDLSEDALRAAMDSFMRQHFGA